MSTRFFTWLRRFYDLPIFRAERPLRRKPLESIRKAKQFLDFERLEERNPVADAIGPFVTTSALSLSGQLLAAVAPPPVSSPLAAPDVRSQPMMTQGPLSPPLDLPDLPAGPNHVSAGVPETSQETIPTPSSGTNSFDGKPLFSTLGQDSLTNDPTAGSKPTGASGGIVDSPGGASAGSAAIGGGAGGSGGSASGGGGTSSAGSAGTGDMGNLGPQGGGPSNTTPTTPALNNTATMAALTAGTGAKTTSSAPVTSSGTISPTNGGSPGSLSTSSSPPLSGGLSPKHHDPMWVLDANNALVITPGVTQTDFSTYPVDLRAQVSGGTVTSYSWDLSSAPDATSISGASTYRLQFTWGSFTGADRTDTITVTENTGSNHLSQTLTFDVVSTSSPAYTATPPVSTSTWPTVLPPDAMTDQQMTAGLGPYYMVGLATGEVDTSHTLPTYNSNVAPITLTYNSAAANAMPILIVHYPIDPSQAVPSTVSAQLTLNGTAGQVFYYSTSSLNPGDIMQIALQANATSLSTGRYAYTITATSNYSTPVTTTYSGSVDVLNYSSSPFGAGWSLADYERIYSVTGGVILDLGSGNSLWFANGTSGHFVTPPGDTSTLVQNGDNTYTRTLKDGTKINFSSTGLQTSVVDRNSNTTGFNYNGSNQLTSISDLNGQLVTLAYSSGQVTSITDPANRLTTLAYDASSNLTSVKDADASLLTYGYDTSHRATTLTNQLNNKTTLSYDFSGRASGSTRPDSSTESFAALQEQGLVQNGSGTLGSPATAVLAAQALATYTDPRSNAWTDRLDWLGFGEPAQVADPLSDMTVTHRDGNGFPWLATDPPGHRTRTYFDTNENATKIVYADDTTSQYTYNGFSEVLQTTDQLSHISTNSYDASGNLTQTRDALNDLTTMTFTAKGFLATQKNSLGRTTSYAYDTLNRLTATTDANGGLVTLTYDSYGNQQTSTDQRGDVTTTAYDALNRATQVTNALGNLSTSLYDKAGNLTTSIDQLGHRTSYSFDTLNRQTQVKDALNDISTTIYDGAGNVTARVDALNHRTSYALDAANRVTQTTNAIGGLATVIYDAGSNVLANVDELGRRTSYSYDLLNRRTQTQDALGNYVSTIYDAAGNVLASVDQLGRRTTHSYDALNRETQVQDALGDLSTTLYDSVGNVTVKIDALGHRTTSMFDNLNQNTVTTDSTGATNTVSYDATGNQLTNTNPDGATTSYAYNKAGQNTLIQAPLGATTTIIYDAAGNVTQVQSEVTASNDSSTQNGFDALNRQTSSVDANGVTTTTIYDAAGNVINTIDGLGNTTTFAFDQLNRRTSVTDPAGDVSTTLYDSVGNATTSTDPLGHSTTYIYDVLNRKTRTVDARGGIVTTLYDAVGNNTTVVDQVGNTTTMAFDVLNRMTQQTDPLNHSSTTAYDAIGRQTSATDRNGQVINTTYDNDNRVLTQIWKNSGGTTVNTLTYSYDSAGNELTAANGSGAYTMSYDSLNRATLTKEPFGVTLTSAYDMLGRRTLLQDSLGGTITSTYDNVGNLTDRQFSASGMTYLDVSLGYTALNQLAAIARSNSPLPTFYTNTSLTYDAAGRMTFLKHYDTAPKQGHTFETITYTYDAASRLSTEVRNGTTTTYQYDATNELTNDTANSYSYDLAGNRTMTGYTTGSANELTNDGMWTYSYDNNGNMTKKSKGTSAETWYYGYDNLNRMTSAKQEQTDGGTLLTQATYVYDVFGDRIEKDVWTSSTGTVVTRFAYDGQNAFADLNSSNQLQMRRLYGDAVDQLFARENSSGTLAWYLTDRLGSVRDVLNNSSTVIDHIDYDGFGNGTETNSANGDRYKWTSRELDTETSLQFNRARYYNPSIGRWLIEDPIAFSANDFNLYRYVGNDPTNALDPSGLAQARPASWTITVSSVNLKSLVDKVVSYSFNTQITAPPAPTKLSRVWILSLGKKGGLLSNGTFRSLPDDYTGDFAGPNSIPVDVSAYSNNGDWAYFSRTVEKTYGFGTLLRLRTNEVVDPKKPPRATTLELSGTKKLSENQYYTLLADMNPPIGKWGYTYVYLNTRNLKKACSSVKFSPLFQYYVSIILNMINFTPKGDYVAEALLFPTRADSRVMITPLKDK